jgi:ribosomal protein S5
MSTLGEASRQLRRLAARTVIERGWEGFGLRSFSSSWTESTINSKLMNASSGVTWGIEERARTRVFGLNIRALSSLMTPFQTGWRCKEVTKENEDDYILPEERRTKLEDLVRELSSRPSENDSGVDAAKVNHFLDSFFASSNQISSESSKEESEDEGDEGSLEAVLAAGESSSNIDTRNEDIILRELKGLRRGSRRVVLQKLLQGGILQADPMAAEELRKIERSFRPPPGFRMKVVHINRTCKGTRSGGLFRFSALVVVGNSEGVLGWGYGKSVEVANAVQKAQQSAYRNLYPIPRHNGHTITEPVTATFGKTKVIMYPKSSGRGIVANPMLASICQLAGIYDIGIKVHGSRNAQNTIKCLFAAFDQLKSEEDIVGVRNGMVTIPTLTGRFGSQQVKEWQSS